MKQLVSFAWYLLNCMAKKIKKEQLSSYDTTLNLYYLQIDKNRIGVFSMDYLM